MERHLHRRAIAGGVILGASAAVLLELYEVSWLARSAWPMFDGAGELARFAAAGLALVAAAGVVVGFAAGLVASAIGGTAFALAASADTQAARRTRRSRWRVRLYTLLAVAPVALVCAQVFRGPRAQKIPAHDLLAVLIGVVALVALAAALRAYERAWAQIRDGAWRARTAWAVAFVPAAAGYAAYVADQRVLPRLYPFFHRGLGAIAFALVALALGLVYARLRAKRSGAAALAEPRVAIVVAAVALTAGGAALRYFEHARALRSLALERAQPLGRVLTAAAWARQPAAAAGPAAAGADAPKLPEGPRLGDRDVFLITVDAMRADRLHPRVAPFMADLASGGVRFSQAYAQVPHTSFSVATLLTGKHVYTLSTLGLDPGAHQTLAEMLRNERYKTGAFYPPSVFFIDHDRLKALEASNYGFEYVKYEYLPAEKRTDQIVTFLESEKPERVFVWVHYLEPHEPYDPHPGLSTPAAPAVDRYDGEVRFVDGEVARLCTYLKAHRPNAIVILAADHGEEFGEHGGHYHGTTLYDEQVRVPLAFTTLDRALPAREVRGPVGLVDVAPTVLALLGIAPSAKMRGRDLGPWLAPSPAPESALGPEYAEIERKKMIARGHEKLICDLETDACQLFDLAADPGERKNLIDERRERAAALRGELDAWMRGETRFEKPRAGAGGDEAARRVLERGRLGERAAVPELAALLGAPDATTRREAARLLARLPADDATRARMTAAASETDPDVARWARIGLARLGDAPSRTQVEHDLDAWCASANAELCARAALVVGRAPALARALAALGDDRELEAELVRALGATHDPAALDALVLQLASVRTRTDVIAALDTLGDPRALDTFDRWVAAEPYVSARAQMARAIGRLAARPEAASRRAAAAAALDALARAEPEAAVLREAILALAAVGSPRVVPPARAHAPAPGELWLVGDGDGSVTVTAAGAAQTVATVAFSGVARVPVARAGRLAVQTGGGPGVEVRWVYFRTESTSQSK
jgi:arylsulfatase A-like enzyme